VTIQKIYSEIVNMWKQGRERKRFSIQPLNRQLLL